MPPIDPPITSPSVSTPQVVEQAGLEIDHVPNRDPGGSHARTSGPCRVVARWARWSVTAAEDIAGDHEVVVGVKGPVRAEQAFPPFVGVGAPGQGVTDQDRLGAGLTPGAIAHLDILECLAALEVEDTGAVVEPRFVREWILHRPCP